MLKAMRIVFAVVLSMAALQSFALEPGSRVLELRAEKWLFDSPPDAPAKAQPAPKDQLDIALIFDCSDPGAFAVLKLLETIKISEPERVRNVKAVAINSVKELEEFFKRNGQPGFPVGADTANSSSFKSYCDGNALLPQAFVIFQDGTLAWAGHPTGVESVVKRIKEGSFSVGSQRKISALRTELQTAIQSGLGAVIAKNAERILALDPGDMIAVQAKLFVFERESDFKGARDFLQASCAKCPKDAELRFAFLDFLARSGENETFKAEAAKCFADFKAESSFQGRFCAFMLESAPFGAMPLALVLEAGKANLAKHEKSSSLEAKASAHEMLARAFYSAGRLRDATSEQAKAVVLRKGGEFEKPASALLEFYDQAATLQNAK